MNLSLALKKTQSAYLVARMNNAPDDRLRLLLQFMQEIMELLASMQMASTQAPIEGEPEPPIEAPPGVEFPPAPGGQPPTEAPGLEPPSAAPSGVTVQ